MITYSVRSVPPGARIEVDGRELCEVTPCEIQLECRTRWVGLLNGGTEPISRMYTVEAFPSRTELGAPIGRFSQSKVIDACQKGSTRLTFDLDLVPTRPEQRIRIDTGTGS
jgi:hypothetical protein